MKKKKLGVLSSVIFAFLIIHFLVLLVVIGWGLCSSFKDYFGDFLHNVSGFPKKWTLDNYKRAFSEFSYKIISERGTKTVGIFTMYFNTILYSLGGAFFAALVPCLTAYIVTKFKFKFLNIYYYIVIFCMVMPIVGSLPAEINMSQTVGFYDHIWGLWLMRGNFLGVYFLVFYAKWKTVSTTYIEAAEIDGANNFQIMLRIMLPLVKNVFFTVMLIQFIAAWNDYQVPLVYLPSYPTLSMWLFKFSLSSGTELSTVPMKVTGCMLLFIPIFLVFVVFNKRLLGNLTMGGIKG